MNIQDVVKKVGKDRDVILKYHGDIEGWTCSIRNSNFKTQEGFGFGDTEEIALAKALDNWARSYVLFQRYKDDLFKLLLDIKQCNKYDPKELDFFAAILCELE